MPSLLFSFIFAHYDGYFIYYRRFHAFEYCFAISLPSDAFFAATLFLSIIAAISPPLIITPLPLLLHCLLRYFRCCCRRLLIRFITPCHDMSFLEAF